MAYDVPQLLKMSQAQLDELFTKSAPGDIPDGQADGTAIIAPGTTYSEEIAEQINHFAWQGSSRDRRQGLQGAELAGRQGVHRPRLLRDLVPRPLGSRRDPPDRAGLVSGEGVLGQEAADRLRAEVLSPVSQGGS